MVTGALLLGFTEAFSAGYIPPESWLEGHAYRHGDIEAVLEKYINQNSNSTAHGWRFQKEDIKRIYFGNWLRDYSQLADTSAFSFLSLSHLLSILQVVGFLNFGFGSYPYEITSDRLGVYSAVEHIDNPRGYTKDAKKYDHRLRGPVRPVELEIDPRTGMKNYIANERGSWDTSSKYIRRTLRKCVQNGRKAYITGDEGARNDAYRDLGAALHTIEDFLAHSNFIELVLIDQGYRQVFPFVGSQTHIPAPGGKNVYPLVTGTFGDKDAIHSLLGEVADYMSQSSLTAIQDKVKAATTRQQNDMKAGAHKIGKLATIQALLSNLIAETELRAANASAALFKPPRWHLPGLLGARSLQNYERSDQAQDERRILVSRDLSAIHQSVIQVINNALPKKDPRDMAADEMHKTITKLTNLKVHIEAKVLESTKHVVDGLAYAKDKMGILKDNLDVYVLKGLEPIMTPLISLLTQSIYRLMDAVLIDEDAEWEVFNNTRSTNPSHSLLSKDHFRIILNEPAGMIARISIMHAVDRVVQLWTNPSMNVDSTIDDIVDCIFHPNFSKEARGLPRSPIQFQMTSVVNTWLSSMDDFHRAETLKRLMKDQISHAKNVRFRTEGGTEALRKAVKQQLGVGSRHGPGASSVTGPMVHPRDGITDVRDSHLGLNGLQNVTMQRAWYLL
ncbi:hypothetical protein FRB94_007596 [Tulasnella sp. JGI-2019a]|nr:hypothetical protein FRB94_007596 [Tulasnella sp. JGI-2019a]